MSEGVVISLRKHGNETVILLFLDILTDTADGLILIHLSTFPLYLLQEVLFVLVHPLTHQIPLIR
jgi:hypothetical protein